MRTFTTDEKDRIRATAEAAYRDCYGGPYSDDERFYVMKGIEAMAAALYPAIERKLRESATQFRVMIPSGEYCLGCQWRDKCPTAEEMEEWRSEFACDVWAEERTVHYGEPRKVMGL